MSELCESEMCFAPEGATCSTSSRKSQKSQVFTLHERFGFAKGQGVEKRNGYQ